MKKCYLAMTLGAFFLGATCPVLEAAEPEYEGKPFSFWFRDLSLTGSRSVDSLNRSKAAIRAIGTNALPLLLFRMSATNFPSEPGETTGIMYCFGGLGPLAAPAIPQLIEMLRPALYSARNSNDEAQRQERVVRAAAEALGSIGPVALEQLTNALAAGDAEMRYGVLNAIAHFSYRKPDEVRPMLLDALHDSSPDVRMIALRTLGYPPTKAEVVVPALMEAARDTNASVRWYAFQALERYGPQARAAVPLLLQAARSEPTGHGGPVAALRKIDLTNTLDTFTVDLANQDKAVRETALRALREFGRDARRAMPALLHMMESNDPFERVLAGGAISAIGPECLPGLTNLLRHPNANVRFGAVRTISLFETNAYPATAALAALRDDPAESVRHAAASLVQKLNESAEKAKAPFKSTIVRRPVRVTADDQKEEPLSVEQLRTKANTAIAKLRHPETRVDGFSEVVQLQPGWLGCYTTDNSVAARQIVQSVWTNIHACPDLSGVISGLENRLAKPESRLAALATLLKFGAPYQSMGSVGWGGSGDTHFDDAVRQANAAAGGCRDVETVEKALESPDGTLRSWAVMKFSPDFISKSDWERLAPKFKKVAAEDNASLRALAVERLSWFAGTMEFREERIQVEASPNVLMRLVSGLDKREFVALFRPLLDHEDERIRHDALRFIADHANPSRAPMWQFPFGRDVCDRVVELSRSESVQERSDATYALAGLKQIDPDQRREALLRLIKDTNAVVRQGAGWGLAKEKDRPEVAKALAGLLSEASPSIRYSAILMLGATNHVKELQDLAHGSDERVAEDARRYLERIGKQPPVTDAPK